MDEAYSDQLPKTIQVGRRLLCFCLILAICPTWRKEKFKHLTFLVFAKFDICMMMALMRVGALKVGFLWPIHLHFSTILPLPSDQIKLSGGENYFVRKTSLSCVSPLPFNAFFGEALVQNIFSLNLKQCYFDGWLICGEMPSSAVIFETYPFFRFLW